MEEFVKILMEQMQVPQVTLVAFCVGGIIEAVKRALRVGAKGQVDHRVKALMAVIPVPLGAIGGYFIIPDGVVPSWSMGIVAGLVSGTAYDILAPLVKAWIAARAPKPEIPKEGR